MIMIFYFFTCTVLFYYLLLGCIECISKVLLWLGNEKTHDFIPIIHGLYFSFRWNWILYIWKSKCNNFNIFLHIAVLCTFFCFIYFGFNLCKFFVNVSVCVRNLAVRLLGIEVKRLKIVMAWALILHCTKGFSNGILSWFLLIKMNINIKIVLPRKLHSKWSQINIKL